MKNCPLCENPPSPELWWAWQEDTARAVSLGEERGVSEDDLRLHMENHRTIQPAHPLVWRARSYEKAAGKLSARQRNLLRLLRGGGALSTEQLASLLFRNPRKTENSKTAQDLRILIRSQFVYRLFLEHLPGEGPRPPKLPALYFLGKSARVVLPEALQKRRDWFEDIGNFSSWHEPYEMWQRNERAAQIVRSWQGLEPRGIRVQGLRSTLQDPLLGRVSVQPESRLLAVYRSEPLALFIFYDNPLRDAADEVAKFLRFGALLRSGKLQTPAMALVPVRDAERGKALLEEGARHTLPRSTLILLSPEEEILSERGAWRSLYHNQSGRIEQFAEVLLGKNWSQSGAER